MLTETNTAARLTIDHARAFAAHADTLTLQAMVIATTASAEVTREHVDAYENAAFEGWDFVDDWSDDGGSTGEKITDPKNLDLSGDDEKCTRWYAHCDELHAQHGYTVEPGYCPAMIAESERRDAEDALLSHAALMFAMPAMARLTGKLRAKSLDLFMKNIVG